MRTLYAAGVGAPCIVPWRYYSQSQPCLHLLWCHTSCRRLHKSVDIVLLGPHSQLLPPSCGAFCCCRILEPFAELSIHLNALVGWKRASHSSPGAPLRDHVACGMYMSVQGSYHKLQSHMLADQGLHLKLAILLWESANASQSGASTLQPDGTSSSKLWLSNSLPRPLQLCHLVRRDLRATPSSLRHKQPCYLESQLVLVMDQGVTLPPCWKSMVLRPPLRGHPLHHSMSLQSSAPLHKSPKFWSFGRRIVSKLPTEFWL